MLDVAKISRTENFEISLTFPIKPEVILGEYVGVEVEKRNLEVTDEEVNQEIDNLLSKNAEVTTKRIRRA